MAGLFSRLFNRTSPDEQRASLESKSNDVPTIQESTIKEDAPSIVSADTSTPKLDEIKVGMGVEIVHSNGTSFTGMIQEKSANSVTLLSNPGGIRLVLSSKDIASWSPSEAYSVDKSGSKQQDNEIAHGKDISSIELTGKITHYGDNHLGWIIGEDGQSYGFNLRDTSQDLSDYLSSSFDKSHSVLVAFTPKTFTYNQGLKKTVATKIHLIDQPVDHINADSLPSCSEELEGTILYLKKDGHAGQIKGNNGRLYRYSRKSLDESLLVYLSSADPKSVSGLPVVFRSDKDSKLNESDIEASSVRFLHPVENDPSASAQKALKELNEGNFSCASVLFTHAIDNGFNDDVERAIRGFILECKQNPPNQKVMAFFDKNLRIIPESCYDDLIELYKANLSDAASSAKYPTVLIHTIDACMSFQRYELAYWYCEEWEGYYGKSHPAVRRRLENKTTEVESRKAICLYRLNRMEEANAIALPYIVRNPSDPLATAIIDESLDEHEAASETPLRFMFVATEKQAPQVLRNNNPNRFMRFPRTSLGLSTIYSSTLLGIRQRALLCRMQLYIFDSTASIQSSMAMQRRSHSSRVFRSLKWLTRQA